MSHEKDDAASPLHEDKPEWTREQNLARPALDAADISGGQSPRQSKRQRGVIR